MNVSQIVTMLRSQGSDIAAIEAKSAERGLPGNLPELISAFANRPGGGTLVLGLDEAAGFSACGVYDAKQAQQAVADSARKAVEPPVQVAFETADVDGKPVVVCTFAEASTANKPVLVRRSGKAYLRQFDGTYAMSDLEVRSFLTARAQPRFDSEPVEGATLDDLDDARVADFIRTRRDQSSVFAPWSDNEVLRQCGVLAGANQPSLAGLLALGQYPQRLFPSLAIQASVWSGPAKAAGSELIDSSVLTGPIATMLDDGAQWVARLTPTAIVPFGDTGDLVDRPAFPRRAVRELLANALVHRDLGAHAVGQYVSVVLEPGRLRISNPGGLYGLSVEALGRSDSNLRNAQLASILLNVRGASGQRVIERLGSGIPATLEALRVAGMRPPDFYDTGVSFSVVLHSGPLKMPLGETQLAGRLGAEVYRTATTTTNSQLVIGALVAGPQTVKALISQTQLTARQVRYALASLVKAGAVRPEGPASRNVCYGLARPTHPLEDLT